MSNETLRSQIIGKMPYFDQMQDQNKKRILAQLEEADLSKGINNVIKPESSQMNLYRTFKEFARGGIVGAERMQALLGSYVENQREAETLLFWGASDKPSLGTTDHSFINRLHGLRTAVRQNHDPGLAINVIFADYHVISNGYGNQETLRLLPQAQSYLNQVKNTLREKGFEDSRFFWLSELYKKYGVPYGIDINSISKSSLCYQIFLTNRDYLEANAQSYSRSASGNTELAAVLYVERRIREKELLQTEFPNTILIAFGIKKAARDIVLPETMPGIFFGDHAPWFQKDQI